MKNDLKYMIDRLDNLYNEVPQHIRNEFHADLQMIRNELKNSTRIENARKIAFLKSSLNEIANTRGKVVLGSVDNKAAASLMRRIARKALK